METTWCKYCGIEFEGTDDILFCSQECADNELGDELHCLYPYRLNGILVMMKNTYGCEGVITVDQLKSNSGNYSEKFKGELRKNIQKLYAEIYGQEMSIEELRARKKEENRLRKENAKLKPL